MLDLLDKIFSGLAQFLKNTIYHFTTAIFAVINYQRARNSVGWESIWVKLFLVISIVYFLFVFGFGIYELIKVMKKN